MLFILILVTEHYFSGVIGNNAKKVLIGCATVVLPGYVYHVFKIIQDLQPPSFWGLGDGWTFISNEDYLPISINKVWLAIAFLNPHTLERLPALASLMDFSFAALLLVFTYRVARGLTGRGGLATLYIVTIVWALLILKLEYSYWINDALRNSMFTPSNTDYYIIRPWLWHSVLPKAVLICVSVVGLVCLRKQKAGNEVITDNSMVRQ